MLTHEQEQMNITGLNAMREWTSTHKNVPADDWRLIEGMAGVLVSSAVGCGGKWDKFANIVTGIVVAIYNISVARGKQG